MALICGKGPFSSSFVAAVPALLGLSLGACADGPAGPEGPSIAIEVAPLTLPGLTDACYGLTVYNSTTVFDATTTVWSESNVCATQYGDQVGSISYVGTCDADEPINVVELVVEGIYVGGTDPDDHPNGSALSDPGDYVNPCTAAEPCRLEADCDENADTAVEFNLTIMRSAGQGFFDIGVNFEDVFCSAKMDCEYDDDEPIELLFNGEDRDKTAVMGFACTAGQDADTYLYLSDTYIVCDHFINATVPQPDPLGTARTGVVAQLSPAAGPGNVASSTPGIFAWAVYNGREQLSDAVGELNKAYSNMAIGVSDSLFDTSVPPDGVGDRECWAVAWATASEGLWTSGQTPLATTSPYIRFKVPLNPPTTQGGPPGATLDCGQNPLDEDGSGVTTLYDRIDDVVAFENILDANWDDPDGDVDTDHYTQLSNNNGAQGYHTGLNLGFAAIDAWNIGGPGGQTIAGGQVDWATWSDQQKDSGVTINAGPVDYSAPARTVTVRVCRGNGLYVDDTSPDPHTDGICEPGQSPVQGLQIRLMNVMTLPGGMTFPGSLNYTVTTGVDGIASFPNVASGHWLAWALVPDPSSICPQVPAGSGTSFYSDPLEWPQLFVVNGPVSTEDLDMEIPCAARVRLKLTNISNRNGNNLVLRSADDSVGECEVIVGNAALVTRFDDFLKPRAAGGGVCDFDPNTFQTGHNFPAGSFTLVAEIRDATLTTVLDSMTIPITVPVGAGVYLEVDASALGP